MKKFLLIAVISFITANLVSANDDKFINALRNCSSSYRDSDTISVSGIAAISNKSISGWNNDRCTYRESVKMNGNNITTICNFTKPQINEIVSVADAYYLTQKYSNKSTDTSSLDAVKDNPLYNVMNKYLQDPSVCTMSGL